MSLFCKRNFSLPWGLSGVFDLQHTFLGSSLSLGH